MPDHHDDTSSLDNLFENMTNEESNSDKKDILTEFLESNEQEPSDTPATLDDENSETDTDDTLESHHHTDTVTDPAMELNTSDIDTSDPESMESSEEDLDEDVFLEEELPFSETLNALGIQFEWELPITPENIAYLAERRPFIQLTTADGVEAFDSPQISYSKAGWVIVNYGDAICCSLGNMLFNYAGQKGPQQGSGEDDGDDDGKPVGTIRGQTFLTAGELISLAKKMGWQNIHIVDGLPAMIWAIWIHAVRQDLTLSNYNPTQIDLEMRDRLERDSEKDMLRSKGIKQTG